MGWLAGLVARLPLPWRAVQGQTRPATAVANQVQGGPVLPSPVACAHNPQLIHRRVGTASTSNPTPRRRLPRDSACAASKKSTPRAESRADICYHLWPWARLPRRRRQGVATGLAGEQELTR